MNYLIYLHQIAFVIMLQSKFFKDNKMGECNLESLKKNILNKFTSAYLHQITIEINSSPINNLNDKGSQKVKTAHMLKVSTNKCLTDVVPY